MIVLSPEVESALAANRPVVALESTILAHGLPAERRLSAAHAIENAVREQGATPATIAILNGSARVGLDHDALASIVQGPTQKASIRDLPLALTLGGRFATTVASTMALARRAGIRFFATGGIGGVHRGAESSFDESTDLLALATEPVLVTCAGAKAVLDLPKTLERLETLGVPVVGYQTDELPAFYHRSSGMPVPFRIDDERTLARLIQTRIELGHGGVLVVQAPPSEPSVSRDVVETWIQDAIKSVHAPKGAALTPFLLKDLAIRSSGALVDVNVELVIQNAKLAARIAVASTATWEAAR